MVTCYDPDAPTVSGFWHWAMYDIPADVLSLPLNAGDKGGAGMPAGAKMLLNDAGFAGSLGASNPPRSSRPSNPNPIYPYPNPNTLALTFAGYVGAAPPPGYGENRYMFVVSALGVDSLPIEASTTPPLDPYPDPNPDLFNPNPQASYKPQASPQPIGEHQPLYHELQHVRRRCAGAREAHRHLWPLSVYRNRLAPPRGASRTR